MALSDLANFTFGQLVPPDLSQQRSALLDQVRSQRSGLLGALGNRPDILQVAAQQAVPARIPAPFQRPIPTGGGGGPAPKRFPLKGRLVGGL